jgi:hypothetical protein
MPGSGSVAAQSCLDNVGSIGEQFAPWKGDRREIEGRGDRSVIEADQRRATDLVRATVMQDSLGKSIIDAKDPVETIPKRGTGDLSSVFHVPTGGANLNGTGQSREKPVSAILTPSVRWRSRQDGDPLAGDRRGEMANEQIGGESTAREVVYGHAVNESGIQAGSGARVQ